MIWRQRALKRVLTSTITLTLFFAGFALGQEKSLRKEIEAIYAKRQNAIRAKDFASLKADEGDDYIEKSKDGTIQNRQQADAEADQLFPLIKEVFAYSLQTVSIEEGKSREIIVETTDSVVFSILGPDDKIHKFSGKGRQRDIWIRTHNGLKLKYHEELESTVKMEG
jgi:hypothetical protein